jgi:Glycosyl transferases group 1
MKIATVYPGSIQSAYNMSDGITKTLQRMGHEVLAMPLGRSVVPKIGKSELESCDLIIVSGLEHFLTNASFGFNIESLKQLKISKAAWYHESFFRADMAFSAYWKALEPLVDHHFFPASYDAEYFGQEHMGAPGRCHWLPHGVDEYVFTMDPRVIYSRDIPLRDNSFLEEKTIDIGFIGSLYDERHHFLHGLSNHLGPMKILCGNVVVQDLDGPDYEATVYRLASNYRQIKVFLNLPAKSQVLVTKVYEVMACGTCLLTPMLGKDCERDMAQFESGKHLIYYQKKHLGGLAQALRELLEDETRREQIAYEGAEEIKRSHTLEHRMAELLGWFKREKHQEPGHEENTIKEVVG